MGAVEKYGRKDFQAKATEGPDIDDAVEVYDGYD
jgi:hypothetical protein